MKNLSQRLRRALAQGPATPQELATILGVSPRRVQCTLPMLASRGEVTRTDRTFPAERGGPRQYLYTGRNHDQA